MLLEEGNIPEAISKGILNLALDLVNYFKKQREALNMVKILALMLANLSCTHL